MNSYFKLIQDKTLEFRTSLVHINTDTLTGKIIN
jgi:hypothetical protein